MSAPDTPSQGTKIPSPRRLKNEAAQFCLRNPQLSHHEALNEAAKARGWPSYSAVERAWRTRNQARPVHAVTLTARWADHGSGGWGRLHAQVVLSEPWANFLPLTVRRRISALGRFHIVRGDRTRLASPEDYVSLITCAHYLSKAARQLVFVDAMRVLPVSLTKATEAFQGDPHKILTGRFPNQDHSSLWRDPETGLHFILNEPYDVDQEKQAPVLARKEMTALTTRDWTLHNPQGTLAQLIAPAADQALLGALGKRSESLPDRFSQITFTDNDGQPLNIFR
jgi:hypothetical protein